MGAWKMTGKQWTPELLKDKFSGQDAYLYCPGPSLSETKGVDIRVPGALVAAVTTAYPMVRPDVWMGLDVPECYPRHLWSEPFMKLCRGNYHDMLCAGTPVNRSPNTFFLDTVAPPKDDQFKHITDRSDTFTWMRSTLFWAIDSLVHMGVKRIHFIGCDMGGKDYYDQRALSSDNREYNRKAYSEQVENLRKLVPLLGKIGVHCISCTPESPINDFMAKRSLKDALTQTAARNRLDLPLLHVRNARKAKDRVAVIVPSRGDRPAFLDECRKMIKRQTRQPDKVYILDDAPTQEGNDQRERVLKGIKMAWRDGCHRVLIIEDDDYYRDDYIETMLDVWPAGVGLIGSGFYHLYHVGERSHIQYTAKELSSQSGIIGSPLHATGFDVELFMRFAQSGRLNTKRNLDEELWGWAQQENIPRKLIEIPRLVISIKHGVGKQAGGCHGSLLDRKGIQLDPDMAWLRSHTNSESHAFYESHLRALPVTRNIAEHMDQLASYASKANCIIELGCKQGAGSTRAFNSGFSKNADRVCWLSVDSGDGVLPALQPKIKEWHFVLGDTREAATVEAATRILKECSAEADLVFIDTAHDYDCMKQELDNWVGLVSETCTWLFHDTWMNGEYNPMTDAIKEFADTHPQWKYVDISKQCNGLGALVPADGQQEQK